MLLASRLPTFHGRTLREEARGVEGKPGARGGGEGAEGEET